MRQEQKIHQTGSTVQVRPRRGGAESQEEPQAWRGRKEVGRGRDHKASDRGRKRGIRPEGPCSAQSRQGEKISLGSRSDKSDNESLGVGEGEIHKVVRQVCPE